jgi:EAL domain-containing protein (putative c-di-GMP-specific phosphodiesterase class I)
MARVDLALEAARQAGNNEVRVSLESSEELDTLGSHGWRDLILDAMHENRWILMGQPVAHMHKGTHLHQEVMLRLVDKNGHGVVASKFIPMATRHRFMADVDRAVVTLVLRRLQDARFAGTAFAVNISPQSLEDRGFMGWLGKELAGLGENAGRLYFEMSRYGCSLDMEAARQFAKLVRRHGAKFGIDRFGLDPNSLQTLRLIPPDYVKLDDALVGETGSDEAAVLLVNAIVTLARSMDVLVIAQGVETEHQATLLRDNHDYGQGFYFGEPTQFED